MAFRQVTVPWIPGYDIGVGADMATGSPMGFAVKSAATPVQNARGARVNFEVKRISTTDELEEALGIDVEASYGCAAFAGIGGRFGFAKRSRIHSSCLFMTVLIQVELAFVSIDDPVLSDNAGETIDKPAVFAAQYGNMFVRGLGRGGVFVGVLRVNTVSSQQATDIAADLEGSYELFSAEAGAKFKLIHDKYHVESHTQMYHEGGPVDLKIVDVTNPLELLENANLFLKSFKDTPDDVAAPYYVTLGPLSIARGPLPPNAADLEQAQQVLAYCAKRRSALMDELNLVDYISDNQGNFDLSDAALDAVRQASQDFQDDVDLLADCASEAINHPKDAMMPADYARSKGLTFPKGALPNPLPPPKAAMGKSTAVPDFSACTSQADCRKLAEQQGLVVTFKDKGGWAVKFAVDNVDPPPGAPVKVGAAVTITVTFSKPDVMRRDQAKYVWTNRLLQ